MENQEQNESVKKISNIIELFEEFIIAIPQEEHHDFFGEFTGLYPFLLDEKHPHYEGEVAIIVGDDTQITENGDGMFKVTEYHEQNPELVMEGADVIFYYMGKENAYGIDMYDDMPLSFRKGYKAQLLSIANCINDTDEVVKSFNPQDN